MVKVDNIFKYLLKFYAILLSPPMWGCGLKLLMEKWTRPFTCHPLCGGVDHDKCMNE